MESVTGETPAAAPAAAATPTLFLRNATGLVKGWSGFDAFVYSFMSVNLVTLGMWYSFSVFGWVTNGSPIAAILVTAVAMTFLCITYAGLIAVMPRAGGDYVWQSRILDGPPGAIAGAVTIGIAAYLVGGALGLDNTIALVLGLGGLIAGGALGLWRGGIGFVLAATGWWLILALWAPIYGAILNLELVQPVAAIAGITGLPSAADMTFIVSLVVIAIVTGLVALGMAGYARIQRASLAIGLLVLVVVFALMAISSQADFQAAFDREAQAMWNVSNAYQTTIDVETEFYAAPFPALDPLGFGPGTWLLIPLMLFWLLYPNWGATLYGEVRGAGDFRKVLIGMLGGTWVATFLAIVFVLLSAKTFGWDFFQATNVNYLDPVYLVEGAPAPVIPIWGYPMMLASFLVDNNIFQIIIVVLAGAWFLGWAGTLFLSSTRMIFAAAFDRILPEQAARVSDRGVPWVALLLIMVPSVVLSWFYAYNADFVSLTLDAALVIAVMFLGSAFAATILPWWKKDVYQNSPMARMSVFGLPLISIAGAITTIFLGWVLFLWITEPLYAIGVGNPNSLIFLGILYGVAAIIYVAARIYRRTQGVDLDAIHAEIPAD
jgi:basic amino acid/polyamine antiporter, APA family